MGTEKVKVKLSLSLKAYRVSRGIDWLTSRLGPLCTPEKELWYPFNRRLAGPQSKSGSFRQGNNLFSVFGGTRWRSWLRHCATSRKVAGSIPDGAIGIFH